MKPVFPLAPANIDDAGGAAFVACRDVKALGRFIDAKSNVRQLVEPDQAVSTNRAIHGLKADLLQLVRSCRQAAARELREGADQLRRDVVDEHLEIKIAAFCLGGSGFRNLGLRILRVRRQERKKGTCNDDRDPTAL
ncbi:hypothetical protein AJ88_24240 [Mesorhizobium amorphae CCBAU 01583]|nr:hypothetical protein AJ88_24240 [Mesorhizobium amorphae CCBAU 01583]